MGVQLPDFARTFIVRARVVARRIGPGAITGDPTIAVDQFGLAALGLGYEIGDTFAVSAGNVDAEGEVTGVGDNGEVTDFIYTNAGTGYATGSATTNALTGAGDGLIVLIMGVSRDDIEDSAWEAVGVLRGNGEDSYDWVGGVSPAFDVIAQDAACAAWFVGWDDDAFDDPSIAVKVIGEVDKDILWECSLELDEVG